MRCLLSLCLCVLPRLFFSQERSDSLLEALHAAQPDTQKVHILNELSRELRNVNPDTAILLGKEALLLSARLRFAAGMAKSAHNTGVVHYMQGNYSGALDLFNKALAGWRLVQPPDGGLKAATTLGNMALVYSDLGNYPRSLEFFLHVLQLSEQAGEKQMIASTLSNIGMVYFNQKNYPEALSHYLRAQQLNEQLAATGSGKLKKGSQLRLAVIKGNIGNIYYARGEPDTAYAYYLAALKLREELKMKNLVATVLGNLGSVCLDKLARAGKRAPDSLLRLGRSYFERALSLNREIGDQNGIATTLVNLGNLHAAQKNYAVAQQYYQEALELASSMAATPMLKDAYQSMARLDSITGRAAQELKHYKLYIQYSDSLANEDNTRKTVQAEMQYEFDKREAATRLGQEKKRPLPRPRQSASAWC